MEINKEKAKFETKVIHSGCHSDAETGAVIPPIYQTSTYIQESPGVNKGYEYSRSHNPTRARLEECLAQLEGAEYAIVTGSGMSAISLIFHDLPKDSVVLCGDDVYGGTYRLLTTVFNKTHHTTFIDTTNALSVEKMLEKSKPNLLWIETPTNPLLKVTDIKKVCSAARKVGTTVIVDNTFMSPYFQKPLELGADAVVHSLTKYINGHSDVISGAIVTSNREMYERLWTLQNSIGLCQSPFDAWLTLRGIKTLAVRMERHQENAVELAGWLESHPQVEKTIYPGLPSHPQHLLSCEQAGGFGGMVSFMLKGDEKQTRKFLASVKIFSLAESLGGVESLICHPSSMTQAAIPPEVRSARGIHDNLVRLSVGIEHIEDLKSGLEEGFKSCR